MPGTIRTETPVSAACAVFKIDFKGRFVYIDDETEDLFGLTREELFGKSIYDFISSECHQVLDTILGHHNRYESFYESLPLTIRESEGEYRRLEAVMTLNFIAGNPVNYQFILIPDRSAEVTPAVNWERRLLEIIQSPPEQIDFNQVAEMFCTIGGYSTGECYLSEEGRNLEIAGSYPHRDLGHSAPAYLELVRVAKGNRFSFIPEDRLLHEGFGNRKSEAILSMPFQNDNDIIIWLYGPAEYRPSDARLDDFRLFSNIWESRFRPRQAGSSAAVQFSVLGQAGDALNLGMALVNDDLEVVYSNSSFSRMIKTPGHAADGNDFRKIYESLGICDPQSQPIPFEQSPMAQSARQRRLVVDCFKMDGYDRLITALAAPLIIADTPLSVYCFIPCHEQAAEAYALNRSDTKLILSVAHDIRAPLITIEAFAKRLQSAHLAQLDDDGRFAVDCIAENGRILQDMIKGLGEMSHNWVTREAPERIYVRNIVEDIATYLRATYPNTDYQIKTPDGLPELFAPKRKLIQLFRNIMDNAFKYSAGSSHPTVTIKYDLVDGWHRFSISDNGHGIDADYRQKVFAPFFRAPEATTLPGTGMGLAIASDIISSLGGKIWIDDEYTNGTRVVFNLPPQIYG